MTSDNRVPDLDELLHPAQAFSHPKEVVDDPDLTLNEKRAILASWASAWMRVVGITLSDCPSSFRSAHAPGNFGASDACAVEAAPALRTSAEGGYVRFDDIMKALRCLDKRANGSRYRNPFGGRYRRTRKDDDNDQGRPLQ